MSRQPIVFLLKRRIKTLIISNFFFLRQSGSCINATPGTGLLVLMKAFRVFLSWSWVIHQLYHSWTVERNLQFSSRRNSEGWELGRGSFKSSATSFCLPNSTSLYTVHNATFHSRVIVNEFRRMSA